MFTNSDMWTYRTKETKVMGIFTNSGYQEKEMLPCQPSVDDLIKRNREEALQLQILYDAFLVIDDQGIYGMAEIGHFRDALLAGLGWVELQRSRTASDLEKLIEQKTREDRNEP